MSLVEREHRDGLLLLHLNKARGNAIDEPLLEELSALAAEIESDDKVRGVLLSSSHPSLFCPGLDLLELIEYDRPAMERFFELFNETVLALYAIRKPVVAALSGHAVAGGCILALTADLRVLRRGGAQIGLAEVKVGVPLPGFVTALLRASVPPQALSRIALLGRNYADDEALTMGLADELADWAGFEDSCLSRLEEFVSKDRRAQSATKTWLREPVLREMHADRSQRNAVFLDAWFSETTRARMHETVERLTKR